MNGCVRDPSLKAVFRPHVQGATVAVVMVDDASVYLVVVDVASASFFLDPVRIRNRDRVQGERRSFLIHLFDEALAPRRIERKGVALACSNVAMPNTCGSSILRVAVHGVEFGFGGKFA